MDRYTDRIFKTVGLFLFVLVSFIIYRFLGGIITGIFIYYSTRPIYSTLTKLNINKNIAAIIAPSLFLFPFFILIWYTGQVILFELSELQSSQSIPQNYLPSSEFTMNFKQMIKSNSLKLSELFDSGTVDAVISTLTSFLSIADILSSIGITIFVMFTVSFYLLRDDERLSSFVLTVFNNDKKVSDFMSQIDKQLKTVFFGNILNALLSAAIASIVYIACHNFLPGGTILAYPALIGFLCGAASLIPLVGMKLVYIPVTIILFVQSIQTTGFEIISFPLYFLLASIVIVDLIPDLIIRPYVGSRRDIHMGLLLFSYLFGPLVFGWYGLFLGPALLIFTLSFVENMLLDLLQPSLN